MPKFRFDQIAINSTKKKKPTEDDKYTYIGLEHLDSGTLTVSRWGSEVAPIGEKLLMQKGDVLFGKRRAYQKKVAIAPFDGIFSAHGMVLRPNEDVMNRDYFPMFISSDYFLDAAIRISVGSLSPTINWKDLAKLEFEVPSLAEQEKAAEVLWSIEETCQGYKKLLAETDELVKSQFIEMFGSCTKGRLGDHIEQIRGVSYKPVDLSLTLDDEHITLLRANNIGGGTINFDEVQYVSQKKVSSQQIIRTDDILMCASSGSLEHVGKAAIWKGHGEYTFGAFCKLIRATESLCPEFIASYMNGVEYRSTIMQLAQGANINNLRNEHINELQVPIPTEAQQQEFIIFKRQSDKSKFALQQACKEARALQKKIVEENFIPGKEK